MVVPRSKFLVVRRPYLEQLKKTGVDFHSWGMKIGGCPSDDHISIYIFGCPTAFLVVPGTQTIKILNAAI